MSYIFQYIAFIVITFISSHSLTYCSITFFFPFSYSVSINNTNWTLGLDLPKETQSCARLSPPERAVPEQDAQQPLREMGAALSWPTAAEDKPCMA